MKRRHSAPFRFRYAGSWKNNTVILVAADDVPTPGIDQGRCGSIIVLREKFGNVSPFTFPLRPNGPPESVLQGQFGSHLPTVLNKKVERIGNIGRIGFGAEFRIQARLDRLAKIPR